MSDLRATTSDSEACWPFDNVDSMSYASPSEAEWDEWFDLQRSATQVWSGGDLSGAIAMLDQVVASKSTLAIKRQAIGFRGSLHEEAGDLRAARADFMTALELSEDRDFERYTLEESAAAVSQRLGEAEEAERWCLEALGTAASDPKISGAGSLLRLLKLRGGKGLKAEEHELAERVVHQAWSLLRVVGEPDLSDLEATCKKLIAAQKEPFSAERQPTPKAYSGPPNK